MKFYCKCPSLFICITKDDPPPGRRRCLHPHASQCHPLLGGGWSSGDATSAKGYTGSRPPFPPPPSKPSTHGSLLLVLCSLLPTAPAPSATLAPGGQLALSRPCRPRHRLQSRPPHHPSLPPLPPPLLPFIFFIESFFPPCGMSLIEERSPSPIYCRHSEDLRPHRRDRMIPSLGRPPAYDTSLAMYGTHPVAVMTLPSSALSIRHPPSTMHSPCPSFARALSSPPPWPDTW